MPTHSQTGTRDRMIEATALLLHQRGFYGASLNAILKQSAAPRGSLYHHFPGGKEELVLEATRRGVEQVTLALTGFLAPGADPAAAIRSYVLAAAGELRDSGYVFGCPVAPILLDLAGEPSPLAELCRSAVTEWRHILEGGLSASGIPGRRAEALAFTIVAAVEGALLLARAERDTEPLAVVADQLATLVEAAGPRR